MSKTVFKAVLAITGSCVFYGAALSEGKIGATGLPPAITDVRVRSTAESAQSNVPVTFGQVFSIGHLKPGEPLAGRTGGGSLLPLQLDVKATHSDGSVRHAIVSTQLPSLSAARIETIALVKTVAPVPRIAAPNPAQLLASGFSSEVNLVVEGKRYQASTEPGLKASQPNAWLKGSLVNEWLIVAPLVTPEGVEHPHLQARFALRAAGDPVRVRVDLTLENNWAYEPGPKDFTYDVEVLVNKKSVFAKEAMVHYNHARWRKIFWAGTQAQPDVMHNSAYLIGSRAIPNYDQRIIIAEPALAALKAGWTEARKQPMGPGLATPYMPTTGGRPDIGLLPGWAAAYALSMDLRAKEVTLGTADLAGSWSIHYRDKVSGRPISILDYPYMTLLGRSTDTFNPVKKKAEAFPGCAGECKNPNTADTSHQPAFSYLPYLVTGDFYHLEELQFWTMYNIFQTNPGYRETTKGLLKGDQVRGQAWSLRTLAQAAYITPDNDPLKVHFRQFMANNLGWYNATYSDNAKANALGIIVNGFAVEYDNNTGIAPWQDDFFTQAIGHAAELGFHQARPLLAWKSRFPIGRMIDPEYCWILGAAYKLKVRDSATAPFYTTLGQVYKASAPPGSAALTCASSEMGALLKLKPGEMQGYSDGDSGYPSNMQPAAAYAADAGGNDGAKAWKVFQERKVKPNYSTNPQFAILPRE